MGYLSGIIDWMDEVFKALASATRRHILDILRHNPGCNLGFVCSRFDMSRIAVMKHLKVLEEADLVISRKEGRQRKFYHNVVPIQMIYDRWTDEYGEYWASRMAALKYKIEQGGKDD